MFKKLLYTLKLRHKFERVQLRDIVELSWPKFTVLQLGTFLDWKFTNIRKVCSWHTSIKDWFCNLGALILSPILLITILLSTPFVRSYHNKQFETIRNNIGEDIFYSDMVVRFLPMSDFKHSQESYRSSNDHEFFGSQLNM